MNGWMDGRTDGWRDTETQEGVHPAQGKHRVLGEGTGRTGYIEGWMDGWMDGGVDGLTDRRIHRYRKSFTRPSAHTVSWAQVGWGT